MNARTVQAGAKTASTGRYAAHMRAGRRRVRRAAPWAVALLVIGAAAAWAPAADATTVSYTRSDFRPCPGCGDGAHDVTYNIGGGNGENNSVEVSVQSGGSGGTSVTIEEKSGSAGFSVTDPLGLCFEPAPRKTRCATFLWDNGGDNDVRVDANLGTGSDSYTGPANRLAWADEFSLIQGGDHNDTLRSSNWLTWLIGGDGDDVLNAVSGLAPPPGNVLQGGLGFDVLRAKNGVGETLIDCSAGSGTPNEGRASRDSTDPPANCSSVGDAPSVTIDDGPGAESGAVVNQTNALFAFSSEVGATFECRQYGSSDAPPAWSSCSSPASYADLAGTPPKQYTFEVRAKDIAGVTGNAKSYTWTVDTEPPDTNVFPFGGVHVTNDPTPELPEFDSPDPDTDHYECRADSAGAWHMCTSGGQWPGPPLSDGPHTIAVRAVDGAGNPDDDPESQDYLIDTVAPEVAFANGQSGDASTIKATFVEDGSGFDSGEIAARLRNTGNPWTGIPTSRSGNTLTGDLTKLSPGLYEFRGQVRDQAGNVGQTTKQADGTDIVLRLSLVGTSLAAGFDGVNGDREVVGYQSGGRVVGTLRTASGAPLAGQPVSVKLGHYPGSAELATPRTQRTNGNGQVAWELPPGPSRTITLRYAGGGRYAGATSHELDHAVEGSIILKGKKRARAGGKLKLKGIVGTDGALMPQRGLLVEVRVKGGGIRKWRTVKGAVRTKPNGKFKLKERLSKGYLRKTKFKFRAELLANDSWPYLLPVKSKLRKVKVLPRRR